MHAGPKLLHGFFGRRAFVVRFDSDPDVGV